MTLKKFSGILAVFTFLLVISLVPSKMVNAKEPTTITMNQTVTVPSSEYGSSYEYSIDLKKGQLFYIDASTIQEKNTYGGADVIYNESAFEVEDVYGTNSGDIDYEFNAYYVVNDTKVTIELYTNISNVTYNAPGGTFTVKDAAQLLKATQTKANYLGNNLYEFTPTLSGTYSFTVTTADGNYGCVEAGIYTFNGKKFVAVDPGTNRSVISTSFYNGGSISATLSKGVTYYIGALAQNYISYTDLDGDVLYYALDRGYKLSISQSPKVSVPKVTISKATSTKKKTATIKWKKAAGISGYQVAYSRYKTMKKAKLVYVSKAKLHKVITKLVSKKTYYVRVRAYKTVEGNKYFGSYSKKLKVKTK